MRPIEPLTIRDSDGRIIAVQIRYEDWVEIERTLKAHAPHAAPTVQGNPNLFAGRLRLPGNAVDAQRRVRDEWR